MQINELLLKNFGKFHDRQIDLDEGINLIHGENESGKSTNPHIHQGNAFRNRKRERTGRAKILSVYTNRGEILITILVY